MANKSSAHRPLIKPLNGCAAAIWAPGAEIAASDDTLAGLSRSFNRMIDQLAAQRSELMNAYGQIDGAAASPKPCWLAFPRA